MKYAASAVIILSSLILGCVGTRDALPAGIDDNDLECLIVEGAEIVPSNRRYEPTDEMTMQEQLALANQGHTITKGNSTIIAVREFIGRNSAVDGQRYRKLTAKLDSPLGAGGSIGVAKSYFVSGSSAFVAWGLYYVSIDELKEVMVVDRGSRRLLTIKQKFPAFRVPDGFKEEIEVNYECELKTKPFDRLNAWEGSATAKDDPFYP